MTSEIIEIKFMQQISDYVIENRMIIVTKFYDMNIIRNVSQPLSEDNQEN